VLKIDAFENPSTGPINLSFNLLDGKIFHKPFNIKMNDIKMEVSGWTGLDQQIDYNLALDIPVKMLGDNASKVVDHYAKEIGKIGFDLGDVQSLKPVLKVEGIASDPKVSLVSLGKLSGNGIKDVVKDKIEDVVDEYLEEANKEAERILAEAQKEADAIIKSAQQKADQVMQVATQTVNDLKNEARIQSEQLVKEAAKQGTLAELAAKKAAQELLKNTDAEANKVLQQAQQQSDNIMENARKQSEATMQRALEKADIIRNN
jgi:vacuolar-type H+-ATPase subunit H